MSAEDGHNRSKHGHGGGIKLEMAELHGGMIAGSVGMVAYAAAAVPLLRRFSASAAAAIALGAWAAVAAVVAVPLLLA